MPKCLGLNRMLTVSKHNVKSQVKRGWQPGRKYLIQTSQHLLHRSAEVKANREGNLGFEAAWGVRLGSKYCLHRG